MLYYNGKNEVVYEQFSKKCNPDLKQICGWYGNRLITVTCASVKRQNSF